jgi:hypothetical protein
MARHRDIRNLDTDEFEEPELGSSFGSSYTDEVSLSRSVEQEYMYRRNSSGNTPRMSHFLGRTNSVSSVPEEDEGHEVDSDDSSSNSSGG